MVLSNIRLCAILEVSVVLLQLIGVASLCLSRLAATRRWAERGRLGFLIAMIGLGVAGAMCGRHDSAFALFAGGTMTALLMGMIVGGGSTDRTDAGALAGPAESGLLG